MAPAAAAIGAEIEAGPVIDWRVLRRRRRLVERRDRQIGRGGTLCRKERADNEAASDDFLDHGTPGLARVGAVMRAVRHTDFNFTHNFVTPGLPQNGSHKARRPLAT